MSTIRYIELLHKEARDLAQRVTAAMTNGGVRRSPQQLELVCERVLDGLVEGVVDIHDTDALMEFITGCANGTESNDDRVTTAMRAIRESVRTLRDEVKKMASGTNTTQRPPTPPKAPGSIPFKTPGKRKPTQVAASQRKAAFGRKSRAPATAPMVVVAKLHFDSPERKASNEGGAMADDDEDSAVAAVAAAASRLRVERHPVCLVLDKLAQYVPFESMPLLRHHPVCRVPSVSLISSRKHGKMAIHHACIGVM